MPEEQVLSEVIHEDTESSGKWETSMQLKEKQSNEFGFTCKTAGGELSRFHCHATGIRIAGAQDQSFILFLLRGNSDAANGAIQFDAETLDRILENFRNEVSEFTDIAAHDLDAPLRKMSVLMDRVSEKLNGESKVDVKSYMDRIHASLTDMRSLVDNLAVLSKLTTDPVRYVSCDMAQVVDQLVAELHPAIDRHNAVVNISGLPVIEGDPVQVKQLCRHLLENALRFSKANETSRIRMDGKIAAKDEMEKRGLATNKTYFQIEVEDNGIGFRQKDSERIFKPFVRLSGKSEYPGTGLGLAICKRIVHNHHGAIYAESKVGEGTRIIVLLPQTPN